MNLIPKSTTPPTLAEGIVDKMIDDLLGQLKDRCNVHIRNFVSLWDESLTPDAILANMAERAQKIIGCAGENKDHIERVSIILGVDLEELLPAKYWQPRRAFIPGPNGTMTLAPPADGYDAWGRLVPVPEPIIEDSPEPVEDPS